MEPDALLQTGFCAVSGAWLIVQNALPTLGQCLLPILGWTLWLAAGGLAATAAELLNKPVLPHALLGLCLPYLYPVLLVRRARQQTARQQVREEAAEQQEQEARKEALSDRFRAMHEKREQERRERIAERRGVSIDDVPVREEAAPEPAVPETPPEPAAEVPQEETSEIYEILYAQPADAEGARPGPFQFTLAAGGTQDIDSVRELTPRFMICTLSGSGKSVRIRYDQVVSVARYE